VGNRAQKIRLRVETKIAPGDDDGFRLDSYPEIIEGGAMHSYEFGATGGSGGESPKDPGDKRSGNSALSLILLIAVVVVVGVVGLGLAFWILGTLFHFAGDIVRLALVVAVVALVWRRIAGHRNRRV
jgi:hypothetical protein